MSEQVLIQYAPYLIIVIAFLVQYKIFVTPSDLDKKLSELKTKVENKLDKYVLKETNEVTINQLKADMADIKEKIDKIYDKIMDV